MLDYTPNCQIQTPEGVTFALPLAGPVLRMLAWLIDLAVLLALILLLNSLASSFTRLEVTAGMVYALLTIAYFIMPIVYAIGMEWLCRGQTIGKRLLRLRVVDQQGLKLQFNQVVIRNLLRAIDSLPLLYLVGGLSVVVSAQKQRLGDLAANTIVVTLPELREPDLSQIQAGKFNSFVNYPHLVARLRQKVEPEAIALAVQALLRREMLEPQARLQLFAELAAYLRSCAPLPPSAAELLSDEQYVRNSVDAYFRSRS